MLDSFSVPCPFSKSGFANIRFHLACTEGDMPAQAAIQRKTIFSNVFFLLFFYYPNRSQECWWKDTDTIMFLSSYWTLVFLYRCTHSNAKLSVEESWTNGKQTHRDANGLWKWQHVKWRSLLSTTRSWCNIHWNGFDFFFFFFFLFVDIEWFSTASSWLESIPPDSLLFSP